jgi:hypothetical protein
MALSDLARLGWATRAQAVHDMAELGPVWHGRRRMVRYGETWRVLLRHGAALSGKTWQAGRCRTSHDMARLDYVCIGLVSPGPIRRRMMWHGRHGAIGLGKTLQGMVWFPPVCRCGVRLTSVRRGKAGTSGPAIAGTGRAGHDTSALGENGKAR